LGGMEQKDSADPVRTLLLLLLLQDQCFEALALHGPAVSPWRAKARHPVTSPRMADKDDLSTRAVWYATEAFGKAAALFRGSEAPSAEPSGPAPASVEEAVERLRADYAGTGDDPRAYFLTGKMDAALYAEDCEFADPFVSFRGRRRFEENLQNLAGGFITDSSTRVLESTLSGDVAGGDPRFVRVLE